MGEKKAKGGGRKKVGEEQLGMQKIAERIQIVTAGDIDASEYQRGFEGFLGRLLGQKTNLARIAVWLLQ